MKAIKMKIMIKNLKNLLRQMIKIKLLIKKLMRVIKLMNLMINQLKIME